MLPDEPVASEGGDQRDARHDRGQDQGDEHEGAHDAPAAEVDAGEQPGQGSAEQDARHHGQQAAERRDHERVAHHFRAEVLGQGAPRGGQHQGDQRYDEQRDADHGRHEQDRGCAAEAGAGHSRTTPPKPASVKTSRASLLRTSVTNSAARSARCASSVVSGATK